MMLEGIGRIACIGRIASIVACLAAMPAYAEIYTWVDAAGSTNVSNLPPPEGTKVTKVQPALPPEIAAREEAARDAARKTEAESLAKRVRELETEAALAARSVPPDYRPPAPPPVIQYVIEPQPAPMQQIIEAASSQAYGGCNPAWAGCALSWWPVFPASVVVVRAPGNRPTHPIHGGQNMPGPRLSPFAPQLTNVVSPVTNIARPVTNIAPPVTNIVAPIPQAFSVQHPFNPSMGLKRG
jgi:hypothetical protein